MSTELKTKFARQLAARFSEEHRLGAAGRVNATAFIEGREHTLDAILDAVEEQLGEECASTTHLQCIAAQLHALADAYSAFCDITG